MAEILRTTTDPETGHTLVHYKSGVIRDQDTARLIAGPTDPALNPVIGNPQGLRQRRREISEQRARDAIDMAAIEAGKLDAGKMGTGEGWYQMVLHTAKTYLASNNIRGMAEIFGKLGAAAGYLSLQRVEFEGNVTHTHDLGKALEELAGHLREVHKEPPALEGKVIDDNDAS